MGEDPSIEREADASLAETLRPAGPIRDLVETALNADRSSRAYKLARSIRGLLPGDPDLGDPLSTASDKPSHLIARRVATVGSR